MLVELKRTNGEPIWINADAVAWVEPSEEEITVVCISGKEGESLWIAGKAADIVDQLNEQLA